ncbi:alpha/beta hydrolase [Chryseobacterium sp. JV558]|uniref:alpha/beta hydrolase n=1 Tax=Chryseobacterium sp. JV558 TaxID=2663236 RepID=UPI00299E5BCF|nr:alpha/beta hydrolase [Chryseobacterium sp. JV558]MDW9378697.1 alpha/beta fold hydrolase [Chryseobacterium sp. JV558]
MIRFVFLFLFISMYSSAQSQDDYKEARRIIADMDSIVTPNGIQESFFADIGGIKQWVNVRGKDKNNPIIIFIHGGPASPLSAVSWTYQRALEEYFTVVNYDQRGAGKTYLANDTLALGKTMHIDTFVDDALEITRLITKKYKQQKVFLAGHSWGTIIGLKASVKAPQLYHAYIGIGQIITMPENEKLSYEYGLKTARENNNTVALKELQSIYPYPGNQPVTRSRIIIARKWPQYYGGLSAYRNNSFYYFNAPLLYPEYTMNDAEAVGAGSLFTLEKVMDEFLNFDFSKVKNFPIPVFMFLGRHDYTTPTLPVVNWMKELKAPMKKNIWFEHSAHLIPAEEPGKMLLTFVNEIRPLHLKK